MVAATRIDLDVPGRVSEAETGPEQPIAVTVEANGSDSHLRGSVTARDRLTLRWHRTQEAGESAAPLLAVQGEIAIEINRGMFQTRSSWSLQCERGVAREVSVLLNEPGDELVGAELDDQPLPIERRRESGAARAVLTLPEPLRQGERRRLDLTSRRTLPSGVTTRFSYRGLPMLGATSQAGLIAIVQGPDLWVSGTAGRGLRQIDPRELSDALRTRPSTVLAYAFVDQPFDLELRVDPSPPAAVVEARTTVQIEPGLARLETDLNYRIKRGRFQEVRIALPAAAELIGVGPDAVVTAFQTLDQPAPTEPRCARPSLCGSTRKRRRTGNSASI